MYMSHGQDVSTCRSSTHSQPAARYNRLRVIKRPTEKMTQKAHVINGGMNNPICFIEIGQIMQKKIDLFINNAFPKEKEDKKWEKEKLKVTFF